MFEKTLNTSLNLFKTTLKSNSPKAIVISRHKSHKSSSILEQSLSFFLDLKASIIAAFILDKELFNCNISFVIIESVKLRISLLNFSKLTLTLFLIGYVTTNS